MVKGTQTGGVKPMPIAGRMISERERLLGMTDTERAWRKQWLKDQELAHNEPRHVPELYKYTYNPIRRFYRWPLDTLQKVFEPVLGCERAVKMRYFTGKIFLFTAGIYWATYYMKYNANDWTKQGGWRVSMSRVAVNEGDPGFPAVSDRNQGSDYADRGFKQVTMNL